MIYFIFDPGSQCVKIGYTSGETARSRLDSLQTGNPNKLILLGQRQGDKRLESRIHSELEKYKCQGGSEWFAWCDVVREKIQSLMREKNVMNKTSSIFLDSLFNSIQFVPQSRAEDMVGSKNILFITAYQTDTFTRYYKISDIEKFIKECSRVDEKKHVIVEREEYNYMKKIAETFNQSVMRAYNDWQDKQFDIRMDDESIRKTFGTKEL